MSTVLSALKVATIFSMSCVAEPVLVLAVLVLAAGVDEQHVGGLLALVEDQDRGRNAGAEEQVGRQADDGIEQVLLDQLLADLALRAAAEQHAVRHDHADAAGRLPRRSRSCG